ncbi:MAG TPA: hypothetical protein VHB20_01025 [Verrucomicrobiae bacterium]|jgi:hypothetical protein|nr:hypothetical protein [Verrucomicrobiae bacterium]
MHGRKQRARLNSLGEILAAAVLCVCYGAIPAHYHSHHEWPLLLLLFAASFFAAGFAGLFWCAVPEQKTELALFNIGLVTTLACVVIFHSVAGMIVGAVYTVMGAGLRLLQIPRRPPSLKRL